MNQGLPFIAGLYICFTLAKKSNLIQLKKQIIIPASVVLQPKCCSRYVKELRNLVEAVHDHRLFIRDQVALLRVLVHATRPR